jgi:Protein of unknown function (DUF3592)
VVKVRSTVSAVLECLKDKERAARWIRTGIMGTVGLSLLFAGVRFGQFYLLGQLKRTTGTIIEELAQTTAYQREPGQYWSMEAYRPIVVFQAGERIHRFTDRIGIQVPGGTGMTVPVVYDARNPSRAMIDRGVWNWMPWAPMLVIGFLMLVATLKAAKPISGGVDR